MLLIAPLASCSSDRIRKENDRLRAEALELRDELASLRARNTELESEIRHPGQAGVEADAAVRAATPHVALIKISRLSHARDDDGNGRPDGLTVYVRTLDGRARFIQVVGELSATAAILTGGEPAVTLGTVTLDPEQLREAYNSQFMGTHYTIELPLMKDRVPLRSGEWPQCDVRVTLVESYTGATHTGHRTIELKP